MSTVALVGATAFSCERIERRPPRRPTIVSTNEASTRSGLRAIGSSARKRWGLIAVVRLTCMTEFDSVLMLSSYSCHRNPLLGKERARTKRIGQLHICGGKRTGRRFGLERLVHIFLILRLLCGAYQKKKHFPSQRLWLQETQILPA